MRHSDRDSGAIRVPEVPGMVKIGLALAVLGLLGYDGFVTVATHLKTESDAQNAAYAASAEWENPRTGAASHTAPIAFQGALTYLEGQVPTRCVAVLDAEAQGAAPGVIAKGCDYVCTGAANQVPVCGTHGLFSVDPDGTVHMVVRRQASTLFFGHLGFMHNLLIAFEQGDANQSQD